MMRQRTVAAVCLLLATGCGLSEEPPEACTDCNALSHDFGAYELGAAEEIDGMCMSWTVGNEEELWVNSVATDNDGFFHHSNWFWVPDKLFDLPDGHWSCADQGFDELTAAVLGGVIYAQSTQTEAETQQFLPGTAIRIPPRARIIAATHLLNTTANAVQTRMRVTLDTLREDEVSTKLKFFRFNYGALDIPPMSQSEFSGHCDLRAVHENAVKDPFSLKLHYVMPHYHTLGSSFRLQHLGGPKDGEDIYAIDNRYGEPLGHAFEQPVDLSEGNGLSFTCGYDNPRAESVGFGIGDQEMCVMLGFAESKMIFDGAVNNNSDVQTGQDGVIRNTGPCDVIGSERGD